MPPHCYDAPLIELPARAPPLPEAHIEMPLGYQIITPRYAIFAAIDTIDVESQYYCRHYAN